MEPEQAGPESGKTLNLRRKLRKERIRRKKDGVKKAGN